MDKYVNRKKIAILLATYNGERFLRFQLDSLLWQTNKDFVVYIHDDHSTDNTNLILNEYVSRYPDFFVITEDGQGVSRGATGSFIWLLERLDSDYYMFCDQDDIWLPAKIQITLDRLQKEEKDCANLPIMVYTDLLLVDEDAIPLGLSLWEKTRMKSSWYDTIYANYVWLGRYWGCSILFNNRAKELALPFDKRVYGHDIWMGAVVNKYGGKCIGLDQCTVLYRQHSSNTSGGVPSFDGKSYYKRKINIVSFYERNAQMYALSKEILDCKLRSFIRAKIHLIVSRFWKQ